MLFAEATAVRDKYSARADILTAASTPPPFDAFQFSMGMGTRCEAGRVTPQVVSKASSAVRAEMLERGSPSSS